MALDKKDLIIAQTATVVLWAASIAGPIAALSGVISRYVLPKLGFQTICGTSLTTVSRYAFTATRYSCGMVAFLTLAFFAAAMCMKDGRTIWKRIRMAYDEPSKEVPKLVLSKYITPLADYPRENKWKKWPAYLDAAWGKWGNGNNVEGIANLVEPVEQVTPLHATTLGNNISGIHRLIADGADVNKGDIRKQSPSYWAAYHGNLKALMIFKLFGADLNQQDYQKKAPLHAAARFDRNDVITFLATQKEINLNIQDERGMTALHVAASEGNFSSYEKLIFYGADVTIKDNDGRTAEEILELKYAEMYHERYFFTRLLTSPYSPCLSADEEKLRSKLK